MKVRNSFRALTASVVSGATLGIAALSPTYADLFV
jgi:hypothetical protein